MNTDYKTARGFITTDEREFLKDQASKTSPRSVILNIGVEYGASIACLRAGNHLAYLVGVDIDDTKCEVKPLMTEFYVGDSKQFLVKYERPTEFAFIDGDHGYGGVMADCGFARYVLVGHIIAFHDVYNFDGKTIHQVCPDVHKAVFDWFNMSHGAWEQLPPVDSIQAFKRKTTYGMADSFRAFADLQSAKNSKRYDKFSTPAP